MATMSNGTKEAREAAKDVGKVASAGAKDIQEDLEALRDDVARLTQQIASILTARGNRAFRRARSNVEDTLADAQEKGLEAVNEAVGTVREAGDNLVDALDDSISQRPYTTLAVALGAGFLIGALWRR